MNKKKLFREIEEFEGTRVDEHYANLTFSVILVQPETAGNIGAIARVMKNFNFEELIIFNPIEQLDRIKAYDTQGFAMHGKKILLNAEIVVSESQEAHLADLQEYLKRYDLVISTTAKGKRYSNVRRLSLFPDELELPLSEKPFKIAILFGKESRGLTNEEVEMSDVSLRIPASKDYPTLNLSHSCAIILYELFKKIHVIKKGRGKNPVLVADKEDRQYLYKMIDNIIQTLKIRDHRKSNVLLSFKNIYERAFMSKKELSLIMGVFSKLTSILEDLDLYKQEKDE